MARLFEYQAKQILKEKGVKVPRGGVARSPEEVRQIATHLNSPVVLKAQVWITGRAEKGGILFAQTPEEAEQSARQLFGRKIGRFIVEEILVEEKLDIAQEFFAGLIIDDAAKKPVLVFSSVGGTGIEEIAKKNPDKIIRHPIKISSGLKEYEVRNLLRRHSFRGKLLVKLASTLAKLYEIARQVEARSLEVNPLALTQKGELVAVDCHLAVDDYAVFRHPELSIEIAREFDRPPTLLEKIAFQVEKDDYRGTFYFLQMQEDFSPEEMIIGFQGAGGGGSMMSMDAVLAQGFKLANYCDTSGNPPASKVYRAARIILSQPFLKGYFASGSGVASQEQYHSARGLVKAFLEENLAIPAVIRLGGNYEKVAIQILQTYLTRIKGVVEGYGQADSAEFCAARLRELVQENNSQNHLVSPLVYPDLDRYTYRFATMTGEVLIDHQACENCRTKGCVKACLAEILQLDEAGRPVLKVSSEEARQGRCTECLACEIFCKFHEQDAIYIYLPIPGLAEYRQQIIAQQQAKAKEFE